MAIDKGTCLRYYKRKDIQEAMVEHAQHKEVSVNFNNQFFGKRPDILTYPKEILDFTMQGVTSFHCSEELWDNPLDLAGTTSKDLAQLRAGWDLVLDIDCKFIEYSKIATDLIIRFLQRCDVKDISVKFSGNKGFHIGVPFEAFPQKINNAETRTLFPEAARKIAFYIKEHIKEELSRRILAYEKNSFAQIKDKVELSAEEIIYYEKNALGDRVPTLNVEKFLEIDTVLIAPRHLYRMPYSLHEKLGLVSLPIDPERVLEFDRSMAHPDKILAPMYNFLDRNVSGESAAHLLTLSLDFKAAAVVIEEEKRESRKQEIEETPISSPIREEFFPPCIKLALNGLEDGKKRAVFCIAGFLGKLGWNKKEIEDYLLKWNHEKNKEPLRDNYVVSQLHYFKPGEKLPPNCNNEAYYTGIGICKPDGLCKHIKNPVNYTLIKWKDNLKRKEEEEALAAKEAKKQQNQMKKQEQEARRAERIKKNEAKTSETKKVETEDKII